jgi:hypothetical protein
MSDKELNVDTVEALGKTQTSESDRVINERINQFTPQEQKKIIRRVDRRLVVTLGFMYCGKWKT